MVFGKWLEEQVSKSGESVTSFAESVGITRQTLHEYFHYENVDNIKVATLKKIALKIGVPISTFFSEEKSLLINEPKTPYGKLYVEKRVDLLEYKVQGMEKSIEGILSALKLTESREKKH